MRECITGFCQFWLKICVSVGYEKTPGALFVTFAWQGAIAQTFDNFSNFQLLDGRVFWQRVFELPGVTRDSVSRLIASALKTDNHFKFVSGVDNELSYEMVDQRFDGPRLKYNGKIIFQVKEGKYRVTVSSISVGRNGAPVSSTYRMWGHYSFVRPLRDFDDYLTQHKKYFRNGKLKLMTSLNGKFSALFDFRRHLESPLHTNW